MLIPLPLHILQLSDDARQGNVASRQGIQQRFVQGHTSNCTETWTSRMTSKSITLFS